MKASTIIKLTTSLAFCLGAGTAFAERAQNSPEFRESNQGSDIDTDELNLIENELERAAPKLGTKKQAEPVSKTAPDVNGGFSGLGKLAPFSEISVLQKRYLPKTNRFQAFAGLGLITNDAFFNTLGGSLKLGYFFTEAMGIEGSFTSLTTSEAKSTKELKEIQGVTTENLVYPKSYMGLDFMWVPIYGKLTYFNRRIINFDMYFTGGMGTTAIQNNLSVSTFHIGTGQIFALNKAFSLRWDFSWNFFDAKQVDLSTSTVNNLLLTVGASFFFPEAKYR
jgi:outer membrane beta-barrel protein